VTERLRVAIVDDEPIARQRLRRLLRHEPAVEIVAECGDGRSAITAIQRYAPDLLFLDIQMPELDGFGVLRALSADRLPAVVFVTAFDQYAVQAFEAAAVDYLLKPFTESRFHLAFDRARQTLVHRDAAGSDRIAALLAEIRATHDALQRALVGGGSAHADRILVKEEGRVRVVPVAEVDYLESSRNNVRVHSGVTVHVVRDTLSAIEQRLDPARFGRIHRSLIVNLDRVTEIQPWFTGDCLVLLRGGQKLRLSRSYRRNFEARLARAVPRAIWG
jgi:two-component system LytT family response regulator